MPTELDYRREIQLLFVCPACKAPVHRRCRRPNGEEYPSWMHADRFNLAAPIFTAISRECERRHARVERMARAVS